jgi:hypothetical protein
MSTLNDLLSKQQAISAIQEFKQHKQPKLPPKPLRQEEEEEEVKLVFTPIPEHKLFNKIIIAHSRALTMAEQIQLQSLYSCLQFNHAFHGAKLAENLLFECLTIDLMDKKCLNWYKKNLRYLSLECSIVNISMLHLKLTADKVKTLKQDYGFTSVIKYLDDAATNAEELLESMLIDHLGIPQNSLAERLVRAICPTKKK